MADRWGFGSGLGYCGPGRYVGGACIDLECCDEWVCPLHQRKFRGLLKSIALIF